MIETLQDKKTVKIGDYTLTGKIGQGGVAVIYKGLKEEVTKVQFAEGIEKGNVAELLEKVPDKTGECHFLPAGTAHSIGWA